MNPSTRGARPPDRQESDDELTLGIRRRVDFRKRDGHFIAEQPAPAPHLAHPEGCAALRIVQVTVPRVSRSCEHFSDGFDFRLLQGNPTRSCVGRERTSADCITQLKAQGPSSTCNESKEEENKFSALAQV